MVKKKWPKNTPSPHQFYDLCRAVGGGPIRSVRIIKMKKTNEQYNPWPWKAFVQYYDTNDATKLHDLFDKVILGWRV
jgi:hypothetical protein